MGRPREFDPDVVLDQAMDVFWAQGFEATSLDEICQATGLGRSSLYATFGDKQSLFRKALARYEEAALGRISAMIASKPSPLAGISAFLDRIVADIVSGPGQRGCFIGNCAAELARRDVESSVRVRHALARVEATFRTALESAQQRGEIAKEADVAALAAFLTAGIQGLRLIGKVNPDRTALQGIARVILAALAGNCT